MNPIESLLNQLETAFREFPLRHVEDYALPELGVKLDVLVRDLQNVMLPIRANTLALALKDRVRDQSPNVEHLHAQIRTIKLKTAVLKETRDWFAYELRGTRPEPEPVADAISLAPRRIQHALRHARKHSRNDIMVHSVLMDQWIFMSVSSGAGAAQGGKQPLLLAFQPVASYVFATQSTLSINTATALAKGLGWESAVYANLTGRHLNSLLRILEQDRNGSVCGLVASVPYEPRPQLLPDGVTVDDDEYNVQYANGIMGRYPPRLRRLEGRSQQPFCDESSSDEVRVSVCVQSADVAETLRNMVRIKAIHPNSPWLHLFRSTTSNVVDLDVASDGGYE